MLEDGQHTPEKGKHNLTRAKESDNRTEEIATREANLLNLGFSQEWISGLKEKLPTLYKIDTVNDRLRNLEERGFKNPRKMIESSPTILDLTLENIDAKIEGLKERGFLKPHKMIERFPTIFGLTLENIDAKIEGLKERGFLKPRKMIESSPSILGYAFKTLDDKIEGLEERGFKNPQQIIERQPTILNYSFENIDKKLKMLNKLFRIYKVTLREPELIEQIPILLGSKLDKLWVLARICRQYLDSGEQVTLTLVNKLLFSNLENLLIALQTDPDIKTMGDLLQRAKIVKKQNLSKEEKRRRILSGSREEISKIYQRYLRGYPVNDDKEEESAVS